VLEPASVGGVTVERASLHNISFASKLGLKIGDKVVVERAGDVIPQVVSALAELRTGAEVDWDPPRHCPVCGEPVSALDGNGVLRCVNARCSGQAERNIQHFVARSMKGIGPSTVSQLVEQNLISDVPDLYLLTVAQLSKLDGYKGKKASNHVAAIQSSRGMPLSVALEALGIPFVGKVAARSLANHFGSLTSLAESSTEAIRSVPGCGSKTAASIYDWFRHEPNRAVLQRLEDMGVVNSQPDLRRAHRGHQADMPTQLPFEGRSIVVTGTLQHREGYKLNRTEVKELIEDLGGKLASSISRRTSFLVVGEKPGNKKLASAKELGVEIITEDEFWERSKTHEEETPVRLEESRIQEVHAVSPLEGKSIVLTGKLQADGNDGTKLTRADVKKLIEEQGGKLVSSVSRKTHFLVVGDKPSVRPVNSAQELGVEVIREDEFWRRAEASP